MCGLFRLEGAHSKYVKHILLFPYIQNLNVPYSQYFHSDKLWRFLCYHFSGSFFVCVERRISSYHVMRCTAQQKRLQTTILFIHDSTVLSCFGTTVVLASRKMKFDHSIGRQNTK